MQHIEDLPLPAFIRTIRNISSMRATEKLDGANLWLGIDEAGKLFTTREGKRKGSKPFYSDKEFPHFAAYNGFRSAMAALEAKEDEIKRIMQPGQMVEMEILYGRQPNAVTYGADNKSYIAFLRGVEGTPDTIADQLATTLGGQSVNVSAEIVDTSDGENLELENQDITYQFTGAQRVDPSKLKDLHLDKHLDELEKYLQDKAGLESNPDLTNNDLLTKSLNTYPTDEREAAKELRADIIATVMTKFKLPIKKELLDNYISKVKPALGDKDLHQDEDVGIEGVVLRDPTTGDMVKIVDKDTFTTINTFNHAIRNQISGPIRTLDPTAPLEARGGIIGNMKAHIADLLGNIDLSRGGPAKKIFQATKAASPVDAVKAYAAQLGVEDFLGTKRKILALVKQANVDLQTLLSDFKEHKDEFRLKLKNGKVIGISPEIEHRTFLVFAESRRDLAEQYQKINKAKTIAQLIAVLYGHVAKAAFEKSDEAEAPVTESLMSSILTEKRQDTDKAQYKKDAYTLMNIYFATVFMSVIIHMTGDRQGLRLLKDKTHYKLTSWSPDMSPLNFWGYPIWHSTAPAVKKLIGPKAANQIFKVARRTTASQPRYLHMDLSFGKELGFDKPIAWVDHFKTMHILQQFDGMNVERINILMKGVFNFNDLDLSDQSKILSKLYYYVQQFIPTSPLFVRLKAIQNKLLLNANGENDQMVKENSLLASVNALTEDEDALAQQAQSSQVDTVSRATPVSTMNVSAVKRKTVKRKRNPEVKKNKFARPNKDEDKQ